MSTDPPTSADEAVSQMIRPWLNPESKIHNTAAQAHQLDIAAEALNLLDQQKMMEVAHWRTIHKTKIDPETGIMYTEGEPPGGSEMGDIHIGPKIDCHMQHDKPKDPPPAAAVQVPQVVPQVPNGPNGLARALGVFALGLFTGGLATGPVSYMLGSSSSEKTVIERQPGIERGIRIRGLPGE